MVAVGGFEPILPFRSRCETITENQKKVNSFVVLSLGSNYLYLLLLFGDIIWITFTIRRKKIGLK